MLANTERQKASTFKILERRWLSSDVFILKFERKNIHFKAGQYLLLGPEGFPETREYSIYSAVTDDFFEILVRLVSNGIVTPALAKVQIGSHLFVQGPFGFFQIDSQNLAKPFLFCATGTGLSPFHSFVRSYPKLNYQLLHGIRDKKDIFEIQSLSHYYSCTSRDDSGNYHGRLTERLLSLSLSSDTLCYLCGNCDMIYDSYDILREKGISSFHIFSEVYF